MGSDDITVLSRSVINLWQKTHRLAYGMKATFKFSIDYYN